MPHPRTWKPGLVLVLKTAQHYGTKWNTQLAANLTSAEYTCLQSTLTAIAACLVLLTSE